MRDALRTAASCVVLCSATWIPGPARAQPPGGTGTGADAAVRAMEEAAARYQGVEAVCATFRQVVDVRLLGRRVESAGRVCQRRPNLFSMRFDDPAGDMVVSDGEHVWVYYPSVQEDQVVRYPATTAPGRYDVFRAFLEDPAAKYRVSDAGAEAVADRDCRIVELRPRGDAAFRRARVWLDLREHVIRRLEVHHENGNVRTMDLADLDFAPRIEPNLFVFRTPDGARVLDGPSGQS